MSRELTTMIAIPVMTLGYWVFSGWVADHRRASAGAKVTFIVLGATYTVAAVLSMTSLVLSALS